MGRKNQKSKQAQKKSGKAAPLSAKTLRIFRIVLLLTPVILILLLEGILRIAGYGEDSTLFKKSTTDARYLEINPELGKRYFPSGRFYPDVSHNFLRAEKPENGYRIFVLGGSSARGYPYYYNGSFSTMLRVMLEKSYPGTYFEMVNLSMVAVNSYTVRDLLPRIWRYQPDLVLIYSGHNEFYGALGAGSVERLGSYRPLVLAYLSLSKYKVFQLVRDALLGARNLLRKSLSDKEPGGTVMERMVKKKQIAYGGDTYRNARRIFRENFQDIINECRSRRTPLIIGSLVSNIRDQKPFEDTHRNAGRRAEWNRLFADARQAFTAGDFPAAREKLQACIALDSLAASPYYVLGLLEGESGDTVRAFQNLYRAKDLDALRFRASEDFNEVLRRLTTENDLPLAAVREIFENHSPWRTPGRELLLEHLHPNLRGYFLMAKAFYRSIMQNNIFDSAPQPLPPDSLLWRQLGLTGLDREVGKIRIRVLTSGWPFQKGKVGSLAGINYRPENEMQKLALQYWENKITWEQAHVYLANHYLKRGQLEPAAQEFKALIVFTPFNPSPYRHLVSILFRQENFNEAIPYLRKLATLTDDFSVYRSLGSVYLRQGFPEKALPWLERAQRMAAEDPRTLFQSGLAYFQLGQVEKARTTFQRLKAVSPGYPGLQKWLTLSGAN